MSFFSQKSREIMLHKTGYLVLETDYPRDNLILMVNKRSENSNTKKVPITNPPPTLSHLYTLSRDCKFTFELKGLTRYSNSDM